MKVIGPEPASYRRPKWRDLLEMSRLRYGLLDGSFRILRKPIRLMEDSKTCYFYFIYKDKNSPTIFLLARGVYFYRDLIISKSSLADFFGPSLSILSMASWVLIVPTFILFS